MIIPSIITLAFEPEGGSLSAVQPPAELRLFRSGLNTSTKGDFLFDDDAARAVMAAYEQHGAELPFDWDHGMLDPVPSNPQAQGAAAGWFRLAVRGGELWAVDIRWTPEASEAIAQRRWRYFSPAFVVDEKGRPKRVVNCALTNLPALDGLQPLVAKQADTRPQQDGALRASAKEQSLMDKTIISVLSLKEDASEAEVLASVTRLSGVHSDILKLTGKATIPEAFGLIEAWRVSHSTLPTVQSELTAVRAEQRRVQVESIIDGANTAEAVRVSPALKASLVSARRYETDEDIAWLKSMVEALPPIAALSSKGGGQAPAAASTKRWEELSPVEKHNLFVENPETYKALRAEFQARKA